MQYNVHYHIPFCQVSANPSDVSIVWTKSEDPTFKQTGQTLRLSGDAAAADNNGMYIVL